MSYVFTGRSITVVLESDGSKSSPDVNRMYSFSFNH